jgi:hypothetical protein
MPGLPTMEPAPVLALVLALVFALAIVYGGAILLLNLAYRHIPGLDRVMDPVRGGAGLFLVSILMVAWLFTADAQGRGPAGLFYQEALGQREGSVSLLDTSRDTSLLTPIPFASPRPFQGWDGFPVWEEVTITRTIASPYRRMMGEPLSISPASLPRPQGDNGRGVHWFPTRAQDKETVDRYLTEVTAMRLRWVVVLQGLEPYDQEANTYLLTKLKAAGIMPVVRILAPVGPLDSRRLEETVRRLLPYTPYFQVFNEPNLEDEWGAPAPHSTARFLEYWIPAAEAVSRAGGYPGLPGPSPVGDYADVRFVSETVGLLLAWNRQDLLNQAWLAVHNYTLGAVTDCAADDAGFGRYRRYNLAIVAALGVSLPMIATEGGPAPPPNGRWGAGGITPEYHAACLSAIFRWLPQREAYLLAFAPWLLGNQVGGGHDSRWEPAAWFQVGYTLPVVEALKR